MKEGWKPVSKNGPLHYLERVKANGSIRLQPKCGLWSTGYDPHPTQRGETVCKSCKREVGYGP